MYSNHEFIKQRDNDTLRARRALAQAKHNREPAPSVHRLLYGTEAPEVLNQSSDVLARILCGDLYHLDAVLNQCEQTELQDSFGPDGTVWQELLNAVAETEKGILNELTEEDSKQLNIKHLEQSVKSIYKIVNKFIGEGVIPPLSKTGFFSYAILGRLAFELRSDRMAEGAFLYGLWLTTLPYHTSSDLDVTLEPRHSREAFARVLGKTSTPAFLFHSFYYSDAGKTTMAALEPVHRRSGLYWMRLAKNLDLAPYPVLENLDLALGAIKDGDQIIPKAGGQLIPLECYHRHFLDDANSQGSYVDKLFPTRAWWSDNFNYLFSTELPAEFPSSLKSYQLSVYFKLLISDPHLSPATRKECLIRIESISDPRYEWVKSSSLLPLSRWTSEITRFHKKPFALELHQMFYPLMTQRASGIFARMKEHLLRYVREGKIGNIKVHPEESPAYAATLMLRSLEFMAKDASVEELPLIKAQLEPLSDRIDYLMIVETSHKRNCTLTFNQALGRYIQSFIHAGISADTLKLHLRDKFRKPGQPIELVHGKKSKLSNILYSLAFDSNVLELISYVYPGATEAVSVIKAVADGISSGSIEQSIKPGIDQLPIDETTKTTVLDTVSFADANFEWVNENSVWLKQFPFAAELLKFYKQCTTWNKDKEYKLAGKEDGMVYLNEMLNSARPASSYKIGERFTRAMHHHYLGWIEKLSPHSQQLFAEAVAHALLGGLIVRHKLKKTSFVEEGSNELFEELHQCISVHGKSILALSPPLLTKDGSTITATEIVMSLSSTVMLKPRYPALDHGIFKSAPVAIQQESTSQQLTNCR
ncbi:hypothetical protein [Legionella bononiensis]|uniref:Uncharacterized protein n=1 Tax=Legionella bononiensis TaxID=2793102 RepID=A0ABS1W8U3_9GAMM|nr:hypothetical protein [Legionella bononiensis]MBL7479707.1 hypothetical protein [Legionella bononiensis]MBL7525781.1 hypothetical protein [Legionella bononiensis]MBL7561963.1 hypothetical protein [Legionella bononiensis]